MRVHWRSAASVIRLDSGERHKLNLNRQFIGRGRGRGVALISRVELTSGHPQAKGFYLGFLGPNDCSAVVTLSIITETNKQRFGCHVVTFK